MNRWNIIWYKTHDTNKLGYFSIRVAQFQQELDPEFN